MATRNESRKNAKKFGIAFGPLGQHVWHQLLEDKAQILKSAISNRPDSETLESALEVVSEGRQLEGYLLGVIEGYSAARCLLKKDAGLTLTIVRIMRRNPNWSTKDICKRLDALGREMPRALLGKNANSRLWAEAVAERNSLLTRRVEKYLSRIRIADRRMIEARPFKGFAKTGMLP